MGWLSMPLASMGGHTSPKHYLDAQFTYERPATPEHPSHGYRVLESACPGNRVYYAALQRFDDGAPGEVTAVVCLVRWNPRAKDGFVFAYKDMSESMGPHEADCPLRVLERLTSTNDPVSLDWRRRCFATIRRRSRKLPDGALIRFSNRSPSAIVPGTSSCACVVRGPGSFSPAATAMADTGSVICSIANSRSCASARS